MALPPAPWAIVICSSRNFARLPRAVSMIPRIFCSRSETTAGVGASHDLPLAREATEVVVGGARALRRDHARADRPLGRAGRAEHLALPRLDHALQHLAALAGLGVGDAHAGHAEAPLGVEVGVGVGEPAARCAR